MTNLVPAIKAGAPFQWALKLSGNVYGFAPLASNTRLYGQFRRNAGDPVLLEVDTQNGSLSVTPPDTFQLNLTAQQTALLKSAAPGGAWIDFVRYDIRDANNAPVSMPFQIKWAVTLAITVP